jgi:hypothetical protein
MKVTVHAEGSAHEIAKQLGLHADVYLKAAKTETIAETKAPSKKTAKAAEPTFDADDASDAEDESEEEETEEAEDADDADEEEVPEHEAVVKAFQKYAKKFGQGIAVAKLNELGYKSITKIKPEMRANVIAAVKV